MSIREKRDRMSALVADWQTSGMSQREYASIHNINHSTFSYWISQHRRTTDPQPAFIQIGGAVTQSIHIRYPNGVELKLPVQIPVGLLRTLVLL